MSLAHHVRERGTWRLVATVAIALAVSTGSIGGALEASIVDGATTAAKTRHARTDQRVQAKRAEQRAPDRKPRKKRATVEDMIHRAFGRDADQAVLIARCESKLDPKARSRAGATGVFQLMPVHRWRIAKVKGKDLSDARTNINVARHLHRDEGWRPWVCARILGLTG